MVSVAEGLQMEIKAEGFWKNYLSILFPVEVYSPWHLVLSYGAPVNSFPLMWYYTVLGIRAILVTTFNRMPIQFLWLWIFMSFCILFFSYFCQFHVYLTSRLLYYPSCPDLPCLCLFLTSLMCS